MNAAPRSFVWLKAAGAELAEVELTGRTLTATGTALGADVAPYRLDYQLMTSDEFVTMRLVVHTSGTGWSRSLHLRRDPTGSWHEHAESEGDLDAPAPGGDALAFGTALDCDLGLSPLTNTMPVLRHGLLRGGPPVDLAPVWVSVPDLSLQLLPQRYKHVRAGVVRFESEGFEADIEFDADGFVRDYPGIARRV